MQSQLEDIYDNFSEYLMGNTKGWYTAPLLSLLYDNYGNIINDKGKFYTFQNQI